MRRLMARDVAGEIRRGWIIGIQYTKVGRWDWIQKVMGRLKL